MVGLGLLLAVIALDLGKVYIRVRINAWNNSFYNAVQAFGRPLVPLNVDRQLFEADLRFSLVRFRENA
jgi:ABC-type uncharacterized transport system fused permease/ATPase subunit